MFLQGVQSGPPTKACGEPASNQNGWSGRAPVVGAQRHLIELRVEMDIAEERFRRRGEREAAMLFADFGSARFFALQLPDDRKQRVAEPIALGTWPVMATTFGRDPQGELYVGHFRDGEVLRIVPAKPATPAKQP